ncbi:MAG: four helix bundle protein [candidate division NC10 bacterium]|nr:four helix bundle protein [candidate division NC10 bacterium]
MRTKRISNHEELEVYQLAFELAMQIFLLSKGFPREELYSLTDQIRRASRSVCTNVAEAWRKRRYAASFVSNLSDAETEAAETQVWCSFAVRCGYLSSEIGEELKRKYDQVIGKLIVMMTHPEDWVISNRGA